MKEHSKKTLPLTFIIIVILSAKGELALSDNLPSIPYTLPNGLTKVENIGHSVPRYEFSESKDELTDDLVYTLHIFLRAEAHNRGPLGTFVSRELLGFHYARKEKGGDVFVISLRLGTDEPLANLFLPKHELIYRPEGKDTISISNAHSEVEMDREQLGMFEETAVFSFTLEQMVELLTSPIIRLKGNEGRMKDFRLNETDKEAILWFVVKVPGGREAISRVSSTKP